MTLAHTDCTSRTATRSARKGLLETLLTWTGLSRQRRALADLADTQLRDIGVSRSEAETEANRAVWDVPHQWRR